MLETSNLVRKYTHIFSLKKYIFQGQGPLNFVDVSIFSQRISFFGKKVPSFKAMVWELCQRFFSSIFSFRKVKSYF